MDRTRSTFVVRHTAVTSAPNALAICAVNVPTPPDAPMTSTVYPGSAGVSARCSDASRRVPIIALRRYGRGMPTVAAFEHADLPPVFAWQAVAYMRQVWPSLFTGELTWLTEPYPAALRPYHVVAHHDDVLVSYAAVIRLTVAHDGRDYRVDGVGNVLTAAPYRRQGHAGRVLAWINDRLDRGDADAAALFCASDLEAFYARAGWVPCPGGTLVGAAADRRPYPELRMMRFLSPRGRAVARSLRTTALHVEWPW